MGIEATKIQVWNVWEGPDVVKHVSMGRGRLCLGATEFLTLADKPPHYWLIILGQIKLGNAPRESVRGSVVLDWWLLCFSWSERRCLCNPGVSHLFLPASLMWAKGKQTSCWFNCCLMDGWSLCGLCSGPGQHRAQRRVHRGTGEDCIESTGQNTHLRGSHRCHMGLYLQRPIRISRRLGHPHPWTLLLLLPLLLPSPPPSPH